MSDILSGIIVGGVGGTIAALTVSAIVGVRIWILRWLDKRRVYQWMQARTSDVVGERYRSTRAIASWNNLTEDRVRYICSVHPKIYLSTGKKEDMWSIYDHVRADGTNGSEGA